MLQVTITLISAVNGRVVEIGRMYIANDGQGTAERGDYIAAVCRRSTEAVPKELWQGAPAGEKQPHATRSAKIRDYPRMAYNVWRLITRCALACFPEERTQRALKSGAPQLDEPVMRGLQLLRDHCDNGGHDWTQGTQMADVDAARDWLDAGKADHV